MTQFSLLLNAVCALLFVSATLATYGVDVSQRTYTSNFQCLKSNGYSFAIVRVYQSNGQCDGNGPYTINDAWSGGMSHVDGYIFPCYSCGNPSGQIDATISCLQAHKLSFMPRAEREAYNGTEPIGATYGMLWLDIEGTQYWSSSTSNNVNFVSSMVNQAAARGVHLGIYSSASQWNPIMGGSTKFSYLPIWYAHYDNNPSFSDFSSFGGWTKPAIKQYAGDATVCSSGVDKNYY